MATFEHLCETFPDENCVLTSREILVEVTASQLTDEGPIYCCLNQHMASFILRLPFLMRD